MNRIKSNLCLLVLMAISFTVAAQTNPYPEEKENGDYARTVTFGGQKPGLGDFINTIVDEAEDEVSGIAYILPRVGKDIKAVIYSSTGKKEVILKWNGLRFDIQQ